MVLNRRAIASALVAVAGVGLLGFVLRAPPSPLEGAAAWCRAHARRGDVVIAAGCTSPDEVDRFAPARAVCADSPPLDLLARFPRVLVANASPTLAALLAARFGPPARGGPASVRVYRTSRPPRFDLGAALLRASVSRGGRPCPRRGARHVCAGASWRTVEPRDVTVEGLPIACVFAHPSEDGLTLDVPLPAGVTHLSAVAGLSDRAAARRRGPAVSLRVKLDGREALAENLPNRRGLRALEVRGPGAGESLLRLELETPSQGARSLCIAMWGFGD